MSLRDHMWRAEELLAADPDIDLFAVVPTLANVAADDLAEVAALQLSRGDWSADRIRRIFDRYRSQGLAADRLPDIVRLAYRNRVADGTAGSWADVAPLELAPEALRLNVEGECGWLGQVIGDRYRLDERLGRGALAVAYRSWDASGGAAVAVKLPAAEATVSILGPIFQAEAEATGLVDHPRVPRILACQADEPLPFLVVQLVAGRTLARWQSGRALPPAEATAVVGQLLDALAAAHEVGVVHRDPSPSNVLIDDEGRVWLTDWNASLREDESARRDGQYAGTPGYASQEGLFGLTALTDPRSDLWSAGAVFYELLAGRRLAEVANREEAVVHSATFDPATLPFPDAVPEGVRSVCRKALHPNPLLRYATAAEFTRDLATGREAEQRLRWTASFELGHRFGQVRHGWLLFAQDLRTAGQAADNRSRLHALQTGVARMILADKILGEAVQLATAVGMALASEPMPDWLTTTIYRPRALTPDWPDRLAEFAAAFDRQQTAMFLAAEAQFASDAMRAVFRLGCLLPCVPVPDLRAKLLDSPLLAGFPDGVRRLLAELLDEAIVAVLGKTTNWTALNALGPGMAALAPRLDPASAAQAFDTLVAVLGKSNWRSLDSLAACLVPLAQRLDPASAGQAFDALVAVLGESMNRCDLDAASAGLAALAPRLDPAKAQGRLTQAAFALGTVIGKSDGYTLDAVLSGLVVLAPRLDPASADRLFDALVAVLGQSTDGEVLNAAGEGLAALAPRLNPTTRIRKTRRAICLFVNACSLSASRSKESSDAEMARFTAKSKMGEMSEFISELAEANEWRQRSTFLRFARASRSLLRSIDSLSGLVELLNDPEYRGIEQDGLLLWLEEIIFFQPTKAGIVVGSATSLQLSLTVPMLTALAHDHFQRNRRFRTVSVAAQWLAKHHSEIELDRPPTPLR